MLFNDAELAALAAAAGAREGVAPAIKRIGRGADMVSRKNYALSLVKQGYAHADVAYACRVHRSTVTGWAGKAGLQRYKNSGGARLIPERVVRREVRQERDAQISRMLGEGATVSEIAWALGVSYSVVASRLRRIRQAEGTPAQRTAAALSSRRDEIAAAYRGGMGVDEIARERGETYYKVYNVLYRLGLIGGGGAARGEGKS